LATSDISGTLSEIAILGAIMEIFEFDGHKYKQASKHQKEWGTKLISEFSFKGTESVLDLGCGDGILTKEISQFLPNGKVLGIDASDGMISVAKELESDNLIFKKLNIQNLGFTNHFDLIFSNATLHWVKDHKRLLKNCYSALKENGIIRFNFAGKGNCSTFFDVIKESMSSEKYKKYFYSFEWPWYMPSIDEYRNIVIENEFIGIKVWEENADRYFKDQEEMIRWIDQPSIVPFLKLVNNNDKKSFRDDVIHKMIKKTKQADGRCFETFRRINVYGAKKNGNFR
jgi:trans-aconitate methyltransferase